MRRPIIDEEDLLYGLLADLSTDFYAHTKDPYFLQMLLHSRNKDILNIRMLSDIVELNDDLDPVVYKYRYQIASLLKRYRFKEDLFDDSELTEKAINQFLEVQDQLRCLTLDQVSNYTKLVLQGAKKYIHRFLGEFDYEELVDRCSNTSGATIGVTLRSACEAAKYATPISGTFRQSLIHHDIHRGSLASTYMSKQGGDTYQEIDEVKLTLVPKSFKALRTIMPNSTAGAFISKGVERMINLRFKRKRINLAYLQDKHKILAQEGSREGKYATIDLSHASDSISTKLVEYLLPYSWFEFLSQTRIGCCVLPFGSRVQMETFATMGIGYTFPLETLIFRSFAESVKRLEKDSRRVRRLVSVYGDDMIVSAELAEKLIIVLEEVGFKINVDKTFISGFFRESCGGDYYRGVDVRPFQPKNGGRHLSNEIECDALVYKWINGLLNRFHEYEVPTALRGLATVLKGKINLCPSNESQTSGVLTSTAQDLPKFLDNLDVALPISKGHGSYLYSCIRSKDRIQKEVRHEPYYWLRLHRPDATQPFTGGSIYLRRSNQVPQFSVLRNYDLSPILIWRKRHVSRNRGKTAPIPCMSYISTKEYAYVRQSKRTSFW